MKEMLIKVEGMKCAGCSLGLEGALEDLPFVASAEADHVAGTAKMTFSGEPDKEQINKAVESLGIKVIAYD